MVARNWIVSPTRIRNVTNILGKVDSPASQPRWPPIARTTTTAARLRFQAQRNTWLQSRLAERREMMVLREPDERRQERAPDHLANADGAHRVGVERGDSAQKVRVRQLRREYHADRREEHHPGQSPAKPLADEVVGRAPSHSEFLLQSRARGQARLLMRASTSRSTTAWLCSHTRRSYELLLSPEEAGRCSGDRAQRSPEIMRNRAEQ
jgi:hypothetical protein